MFSHTATLSVTCNSYGQPRYEPDFESPIMLKTTVDKCGHATQWKVIHTESGTAAFSTRSWWLAMCVITGELILSYRSTTSLGSFHGGGNRKNGLGLVHRGRCRFIWRAKGPLVGQYISIRDGWQSTTNTLPYNGCRESALSFGKWNKIYIQIFLCWWLSAANNGRKRSQEK